jgi:hypothetical protein
MDKKMTDSVFLVYHGVTIKLTPDDDVVETGWEIGQYADNLGRRIAYYEVRHRRAMTDSEYTEMIRRVKEIVR